MSKPVLVVLGTVYASDAGPPLQAAAVTAITLVPVLTWLSVLATDLGGGRVRGYPGQRLTQV